MDVVAFQSWNQDWDRLRVHPYREDKNMWAPAGSTVWRRNEIQLDEEGPSLGISITRGNVMPNRSAKCTAVNGLLRGREDMSVFVRDVISGDVLFVDF